MSRRLRRLLLLALVLFVAPGLLLSLCFAVSSLPLLPVAPREDLTLSCVTLIQPGKGRRECVDLRIADGKIAAIQPSAKGTGTEKELYVLPGLIDAHVHSPLWPADRALYATLYLLHGITTVRNLGDGNQSLKLKPLYEGGQLAGPRLLACGVHLDGPPGAMIAKTLRTPQEARKMVEELAARGADCIKVLSNLEEGTYLSVRAAAREHGLPVVGHMVNALSKDLDQAQMDEVQHLTGVPDAPSPGFDDAAWDRWHRSWDTVDDARVATVIAAALKGRTAHTPTLVGPAYAALRGDAGAPIAARLDLLPSWHVGLWQALGRGVTQPQREQARRNLPRYLAVVGRMHQAGVPLLTGSDTFQFIPFVVPGAGLLDELRLLNRAGLTPEQALAAATTLPVRSRRTPDLGRLAVGAPADLLVLGEDPTVSLDHLGSLRTVIVDGRRYQRDALAAHLERQLAATRRMPYSLCARVLGWIFLLFV